MYPFSTPLRYFDVFSGQKKDALGTSGLMSKCGSIELIAVAYSKLYYKSYELIDDMLKNTTK